MAITLSLRNFTAIAANEVLLNSKRVAPYVLMILFAGNALLWWAKGPAVQYGWATNSEHYIVRNLIAFSFLLGLPIFNAVIMADSVVRDFRFGIDPLIFSKPISRAQYLLGKFAGNFFALVCCQSAFVLTLIMLQFFRTSGMIVQAFRVWPYFKHFFFLVVISHLLLAAVYFTVGTLTRSTKIVYGLAVGFYPVYIGYMFAISGNMSRRWATIVDPFILNAGIRKSAFTESAEYLNQLVVFYSLDLIVNRLVIILLTAICLTILYKFFTTTERAGKREALTVINLSTASAGVYYPERSPAELLPRVTKSVPAALAAGLRQTSEGLTRDPSAYADGIDLTIVNEGMRANLNKLVAALGLEFRLLRAERSLVIIMPLAIFISLLEVTFFNIHPDVSLSAAYASNTATSLLLALIGMAVFYSGEAIHRDREIRFEPLLWTTPVPNSVLILSKFLAILVLLCSLILSVAVAAFVIQLFRGHTPIEFMAYAKVYGLILLPSALVLTAVSVAASIVLRNKYAFYVVITGAAAGLFYLYNTGYNHWLYNPVLYRLWSYSDLAGVSMWLILWRRAIWLMGAIASLVLAHFFFPRRPSRRARHSL